MHLIFENVLKNLLMLWTGDYKGLDTGSGEYQIVPTVWDAIGAASIQSGDTIPSVFGPRPPNHCFWSLYIGPVLLKGHFKHSRYYNHFVQFVKLINMCLQYEVSEQERIELKTGFNDWVWDYERWYYQYEPNRLSACPLTIHALLHIVDSILAAGLVWTSWAFPMERYCGALQPAIRSRHYPYASLNRYVLDSAHLTHIKLLYNLHDKLAMKPPNLGGFYRAVCIPGYHTCSLLPPYWPPSDVSINAGLRTKVIAALCTKYHGTPTATRAAIATSTIEEWGHLRIFDDGDIVRTAAFAQSDTAAQATTTTNRSQHGSERDATHYEALVDRHERSRNHAIELLPRTFYGQLQHIYVLDCPPIPGTAHSTTTRIIFAVICTCAEEETHPTLDIHYYSRYSTLKVLDITTIQCLVGRIHDRGQWAIIDRSGALSRAIYEADGEGSDDE
ncbi:hypothetical protein C8Q74DRAFT_1320437 [Fomes fomentarius]|nr:hypothetical protein C8Q74DRAFT_1320437 [Fomes fomentarius]